MKSLAAIFLGSLLVIGVGPLAAQTLRIYHIDVEQGSATLVVAPGGRTLLVDSGKNSHGSKIRTVMQQAGVSQIDLFVDTHYHEDHYGGIDDLVDSGVSVLESFDRGDKACCLSQAKKNEPAFKGYQRTVGEDAQPLRAGEVLNLDPLMTVTCLGSGGMVAGETGISTAQDENDMSISLLVVFGGFRYFIGGDTHAPTEAKIAARHLATNVDVYVANHHGSNTSSSAAFLTDGRPTVVIISNGNRIDYAHPRQTTLNRLNALMPTPTVFQTNKYLAGGPLGGGNVPDAFIADPETTDEDGTILLTVNGATNTYTVSYGTTSQNFTAKAPASPVTTTSGVVIESLLPNPPGPDEQLEEVTLRNRGTAAVSLVGWTLRDRSGLHWDLTGSLAAGQARSFRRNGQAMSLNNGGDDIVLLDTGNVQRDRFSYSASSEGTVIKTLH